MKSSSRVHQPGEGLLHRHTGARRQRGATLVVVISLLLAVGLMSLTGLFLARNQYQLVSNLQFQDQAFNDAETAAAAAESWLLDPGSVNDESPAFDIYNTTTPGLYPAGELGNLRRVPETMTWGASNSMAAGQGRYLIEQVDRSITLPGSSLQAVQASTGACNSADLFRIAANSSGTRGSSRMVETIFATNGCN